MALSSNQRAIKTARAGAGRAGISRCGFVPRSTQGSLPATSPYSAAGGFYIWATQQGTDRYGPTTTWTVTRSA